MLIPTRQMGFIMFNKVYNHLFDQKWVVYLPVMAI
jgi:hypothetical protein